jgi:hypothetical protein
MYIQNCLHHAPQGLGGATIGKTIFTYVYIKKKSSLEPVGQFLMKLGSNHPLVKDVLNCSNKGPGSLQRGDNRKNGV